MYRKTLREGLPHLGAYLVLVLLAAVGTHQLHRWTTTVPRGHQDGITVVLAATGGALLLAAAVRHLWGMLVRTAREELTGAVPQSRYLREGPLTVVRANHRYQRASEEVQEIYTSLVQDAQGGGRGSLELLETAEALAAPKGRRT